MLGALERVKGQNVIVLEDDDWYGPEYVATMAAFLEEVELAGFTGFLLYNVCYRRYRPWDKTAFTCMSHTAFRRNVVPLLQKLIQDHNTAYPDVLLWQQSLKKRVWEVSSETNRLTVGLKGLPGRAGLSFGHRPRWSAFRFDPHAAKLREIIGEDVDLYLEFYNPEKPFFEPWLKDRL